jgi:hypothetical protein
MRLALLSSVVELPARRTRFLGAAFPGLMSTEAVRHTPTNPWLASCAPHADRIEISCTVAVYGPATPEAGPDLAAATGA